MRRAGLGGLLLQMLRGAGGVQSGVAVGGPLLHGLRQALVSRLRATIASRLIIVPDQRSCTLWRCRSTFARFRPNLAVRSAYFRIRSNGHGASRGGPPWHQRVRRATRQGQYDQEADFARLHAALLELEGGSARASRLFFLSVPPTVFGLVCENVHRQARAVGEGYTRLIIEKPFGRDSRTFGELNCTTSSLFREEPLCGSAASLASRGEMFWIAS